MANPEAGWRKGQWLFYCDVCNKKMLSTDAKRRWDGLYVCKNDWEPRHPSDFIRAIKETSNILPWSRPGIPDDNAPSVLVCTLPGRSSFAGYAVAGCSIAGFKPDLGLISEI